MGKAQRETATCQMVIGCRGYRTGYAGNQLGKPMFSNGQQRAGMMMMKRTHDIGINPSVGAMFLMKQKRMLH